MSYVAVAGIGVSLVTSVLGSKASQKTAKAQLKQAWDAKVAEIASNEKLTLEQIRTSNETERIKIFLDNVKDYRVSLQKESTIRLRDSWIYIASLGCGTGVLYGISLMYSKKT